MKVKQISVFLENKSGRLAEVTRILGARDVNIRALSIADTTDFGILRLIVSDPLTAFSALKEAGFMVSETEVLAVEVPDRPGGLSRALTVLQQVSVNIEYLYAFMQKASDAALVVMRVDDCDKALDAFKAQGINVLDEAAVYAL